MKNYNEKQPLVVNARFVAYALVGTAACIQNSNSVRAKNQHIESMKEYQALLETFGDLDD